MTGLKTVMGTPGAFFISLCIGGYRTRRKVAAVGPRQAWATTPARVSAFGVPPKLISPNAGALSSHEDWESCARCPTHGEQILHATVARMPPTRRRPTYRLGGRNWFASSFLRRSPNAQLGVIGIDRPRHFGYVSFGQQQFSRALPLGGCLAALRQRQHVCAGIQDGAQRTAVFGDEGPG